MTSKKSMAITNASGFSLVELMVVVAIIGILASVAVPQFQAFTYKARLTEAKAGLTSIYTAEKAFYGEWAQFDNRFGAIGYQPEGTYFFNIGFAGGTTASTNTSAAYDAYMSTSGASVTQTKTNTSGICLATLGTTASAGQCIKMTSASGTPTTDVDNTKVPPTFTAQALADGTIHPKGVQSNLSIDVNKTVRQVSGNL